MLHSNKRMVRTLDIGAGRCGCQSRCCGSADGLGSCLPLGGSICTPLHLQSLVPPITPVYRRTACRRSQALPVLA